jgi:hypothetical protein
MSDYIALELGTEDKLDALRYLNVFRFWYSLDHERRCQRRGRSITARQSDWASADFRHRAVGIELDAR